MKELKTSEAQRKSAQKWDEKNAGRINIKAKKDDVDLCKEYAEMLGITASKFAMKAMHYCIANKITFGKDDL